MLFLHNLHNYIDRYNRMRRSDELKNKIIPSYDEIARRPTLSVKSHIKSDWPSDKFTSDEAMPWTLMTIKSKKKK